MKKVIIFCLLCLASILLSSSTAYAANCGGSVACSCGDTLNTSRILNASDNLTGCAGNGLTIDVNNAVLDCDGFTISGPGTSNYGLATGFGASGRDNITIKNCNITNFQTGIGILFSSDNTTVVNNNITLGVPATRGVSFAGFTKDNNVTRNNIVGVYGIYFLSAPATANNNKIYHNNIYALVYGAYASSGSTEFSYNQEGNFWNHTSCPVFTAGSSPDSNIVGLVDSYAYDAADGWLTGDPADCVTPSAAITAPSSGTVLPSMNYLITGTASDNVGISSVDVIITGSGTYSANYDNNTNTWNYTWDTSAEGDGFYNITVNASDAAGNYNDTSTVTDIEIDKTKPVISSVAAGSITSSGAVITWTTDENANTTVDYGTTTALGSTSADASYVANHSISLSSLSASTLYYYNVTSCDQVGNCQEDGGYNFTTSAVSGNGGGGGGTAGPKSIGTVTDAELGASLSKYIDYSFNVDGDSHKVDVRSIDFFNRKATFTVSSTPVTFTLGEGQSKLFDFNSDGKIDLEFILNKISTSNFVDVTLKRIVTVVPPPPIELPEEPVVVEVEEEVEEIIEAPPAPEKPNRLPYVLAGVVILLVIAVAFQLTKPKKRKKFFRAK